SLPQQPAEDLQRILYARRERMFRRQPVLGEQHAHMGRATEVGGKLAMRARRSRNIAAAMQEQKDAILGDARHVHPLAVDVADHLPRKTGTPWQDMEPGLGLPLAAALLKRTPGDFRLGEHPPE